MGGEVSKQKVKKGRPTHTTHPPAANVGLGVKPLPHEHGLDPVRYPRRLAARRLGQVRRRPPREVGAEDERVARLLEGRDLFGLERRQGDALDAVGELATGCCLFFLRERKVGVRGRKRRTRDEK